MARRFQVDCAGRSGSRLSVHLRGDRDVRVGGYLLNFDDTALVVRSADAAGFRHALETVRQIASEGFVPTGSVDDRPDLSVRGFHLNFANCRGITIDEAVRLIETAARFKLNTILVEYGPRFPFTSHPQISDAAALTAEDVARLNAVAAEQGIDLIPLQQSLAHLEYALGHDEFAPLRERRDRHNLMCPSNPESLALFKSLAAEIIALHPRSTWFHLGGDEARKIGRCPECAAFVKRHGHGELYGRYIAAAARWLLEQGRRPIVWDDTLCTFPSAIQHLPPETIIAYWDYIVAADPTPVLIPRMAHAAGGPRVAHDWSWRLPRNARRLSDVQRDVMRGYSRPVRLKSALGEAFLREFGPYLGEAFPQWVRALPYLEYYQDRGHDVITSPTGMGNGDTQDGVPNFARFERNIRTHAERCKANGRALGMITTAWYNVPPEMLYHGLVLTAQWAW